MIVSFSIDLTSCFNLQSLQKWKKPGYRFVQQPGYVWRLFFWEDKDARQEELSAERLNADKAGSEMTDSVRIRQTFLFRNMGSF